MSGLKKMVEAQKRIAQAKKEARLEAGRKAAGKLSGNKGPENVPEDKADAVPTNTRYRPGAGKNANHKGPETAKGEAGHSKGTKTRFRPGVGDNSKTKGPETVKEERGKSPKVKVHFRPGAGGGNAKGPESVPEKKGNSAKDKVINHPGERKGKGTTKGPETVPERKAGSKPPKTQFKPGPGTGKGGTVKKMKESVDVSVNEEEPLWAVRVNATGEEWKKADEAFKPILKGYEWHHRDDGSSTTVLVIQDEDPDKAKEFIEELLRDANLLESVQVEACNKSVKEAVEGGDALSDYHAHQSEVEKQFAEMFPNIPPERISQMAELACYSESKKVTESSEAGGIEFNVSVHANKEDEEGVERVLREKFPDLEKTKNKWGDHDFTFKTGGYRNQGDLEKSIQKMVRDELGGSIGMGVTATVDVSDREQIEDLDTVAEVYSGKPGCMCGCLGKYASASKHKELVDAARGYATDDVSDRSVKIISNKINKLMQDPEVRYERTDAYVFLDTGTRYYAAYFVKGMEDQIERRKGWDAERKAEKDRLDKAEVEKGEWDRIPDTSLTESVMPVSGKLGAPETGHEKYTGPMLEAKEDELEKITGSEIGTGTDEEKKERIAQNFKAAFPSISSEDVDQLVGEFFEKQALKESSGSKKGEGRFVVTGLTKGASKEDAISPPFSKKTAEEFKKSIEEDLKKMKSEYRWVTKLKVVPVESLKESSMKKMVEAPEDEEEEDTGEEDTGGGDFEAGEGDLGELGIDAGELDDDIPPTGEEEDVPPGEEGEHDIDNDDPDVSVPQDSPRDWNPGDKAMFDYGEGPTPVEIADGTDDRPYRKEGELWGEFPRTMYLVKFDDAETGQTIEFYAVSFLLK